MGSGLRTGVAGRNRRARLLFASIVFAYAVAISAEGFAGMPVIGSDTAPALEAGGVRIETPTDGTYDVGDVDSALSPLPADFEIWVDTFRTTQGSFLSFVSSAPVVRIVVNGIEVGPNTYSYSPGTLTDSFLHTPMNTAAKFDGISHVDFYFGDGSERPETGGTTVYRFRDDNCNGEWDVTLGESMLEGWAFTLYDAQGAKMRSGVTRADGRLKFCGLLPGRYIVTETSQQGWADTGPLSQTVEIEAFTCSTPLWFGGVPASEAGGIVIRAFEDLDESSAADVNERMLEGWDFTVTRETEPVVLRVLGASTSRTFGAGRTDSAGELAFPVLAPGEYTITQTPRDGWAHTTLPVRTVRVVAGQVAEVSFGTVEKAASLGDVDLAITTVADAEAVGEGQLVKYTIRYRNLGEGDALDFTIVDDYDERFLDIVDAGGGAVSRGTITWTFPGPLSHAMGEQTIDYTARVQAEAPDESSSVDGFVVIDGARDSDSANNRDDVRVAYSPAGPVPRPPGRYLALLGVAWAAVATGLLMKRRKDNAA